MFIGEYQHTIDEKGRLAVPAKFRQLLSKGAVVTKGLDNCLSLYPKVDWQKEADKLASMPYPKAGARDLNRMLIGGAMDVQADKQGRILIPEYLREYAGIKKQTVLVGLYSRLEIWDETKWREYKKEKEKQIVNIAEALGT